MDEEVAAEAAPAPERPHYHGHRKRLREHFLKVGPSGLRDYEILELLLFHAYPRIDTKPLAKALLKHFHDDLGEVLAAEPHRLKEVEGIGDAAVAALKIVEAAAAHLLKRGHRAGPVIGRWDQLLDYVHGVMAREPREQFRLLFLDGRNRLILDEVQQRGTVNHTPVYPREVVRRALELNATAVIMVHNHPSGDPKPSQADIAITREVKAALTAVSIQLHDHVIVGREGYTSFKSKGLL